LLNGLASASSLFLVSAGLSLIFGVMRIVNFAHGSFFMLGIYVAYSLVEHLGAAIGFWPALLLAPLATAALGALVEVVLLRRIYRAPELFQLLATFALVLVIKDAVLWAWGPEELFGPRAPGLEGAVEILGRQFPTYDLFLMAVGPLVLGLLWLAAAPHALGHAGARSHARPRHGGRPGRQPGLAVHRRVCAGRFAGRAWPARCSCRASPPSSTWT
jgi:branched-chain amino acid transport system permease protein